MRMKLINTVLTSERVNGIPVTLIQFTNLMLRSAVIWVLYGIYLHAQVPKPGAEAIPGVPLPNPPEVRSPFLLFAVSDPETGKSEFSFAGREIPPVIRASPGQDIRLTYKNEMSPQSRERCVDGPCMNMTNLHFHGLHVSPNAPQDDVLTMMAMPGQSLQYVVNIPLDQPPGLYWYHTHPHGESYQQDLDGMSGAIVIDGMERYIPEVRQLRERILILRDRVVGKDDPTGPELRRAAGIPERDCSATAAVPE